MLALWLTLYQFQEQIRQVLCKSFDKAARERFKGWLVLCSRRQETLPGFDSRVGLFKLSPNLHFHKFIWAVASLPRCDFYLKRMEVDLDMIGLGAEREWWCISQYALHIMQSCSIFNLHMHTTSCCRCLHLILRILKS